MHDRCIQERSTEVVIYTSKHQIHFVKTLDDPDKGVTNKVSEIKVPVY